MLYVQKLNFNITFVPFFFFFYFQLFQSLSISCESPDLPTGAVVRPKHSVETVTECLTQLRDDMKKLLETTWPKISATGT